MTGKIEEKGAADGSRDHTEDGTVDIKGNPALRSKSGRWKACSFMLGYEVFERMAYYGIVSNLVLYLTRKLHEGTVTSSNNVTNWAGTVWILPVFGAYIADAHLGRFRTFVIASGIYLVGMSLLTLAVSVPALRPPSCGHGIKEEGCDKPASALQKGIFYGALYIIAVGTGGTKPNISTMGADQFDDFEPKEKQQKLSFFNWWMFSIFFGTLFSNTFLVYIQDNVGWTLGYGIPTLGLALSIIIFLTGSPFYRHKLPAGSPFTRMAQVLVAAVRKWKVSLPNDPGELHELGIGESAKSARNRIDHTHSLRLLDKAAVRSGPTSPWCHGSSAKHVFRQTRDNLRQKHGTPFRNPSGQPRIICDDLHAGKPRAGISDTFLEVAKLEFFYDQAPEGMKSLGTSYFCSSIGVGNYLSSFILSTTITMRSWPSWAFSTSSSFCLWRTALFITKTWTPKGICRSEQWKLPPAKAQFFRIHDEDSPYSHTSMATQQPMFVHYWAVKTVPNTRKLMAITTACVPALLSNCTFMLKSMAVTAASIMQSLAYTQMENPNVFVYNAMIKGFVQSYQPVQALELYVQMLRANVSPSSYTFPSLIKACGLVSQLRFAEAVHGQVWRNGFDSHLFVQTSLVDFYSSMGRIEESIRVFDEMPERDVFAWTTMVSSLVRVGDMSTAGRLFDMMPDRNLAAWNTLIDGYARLREVDVAELLFNQMPARDIISWTTMINCYSQNKRYREALGVFNEMAKHGIDPDEVTMATVISACAHLGALDLGKEIHYYVMQHGFNLDPGNSGYYTLLVNMNAEVNRWSEAAKIRLTMKEQGVEKRCPGSSWIELESQVHEFSASDKSHAASDEIYSLLDELDGQMKLAGYVPELWVVL
ncbi:PROTEIN NRT1/ PTR FAMILY 5.2-LIKE [Salix koriyanagi]|uniref:PROTEIN NRT1/ PTR FAMILY 5.2-LIKE n=1 Tax=Salix koriyanagi TaxID=2511006 RepID=A0A9Q0TG70_9ROSI|nr:PROTEIN NRT1/ PTR FAMILY 5.2-LIKE [Salix koriyanagi]